jgi:hypothetical protein
VQPKARSFSKSCRCILPSMPAGRDLDDLRSLPCQDAELPIDAPYTFAFEYGGHALGTHCRWPEICCEYVMSYLGKHDCARA